MGWKGRMTKRVGEKVIDSLFTLEPNRIAYGWMRCARLAMHLALSEPKLPVKSS